MEDTPFGESSDLSIRRAGFEDLEPVSAAARLYEELAQPDTRLVLFYCAPEFDRAALGAEIAARFPDSAVIGCTTSGEITPTGYRQGTITAVSIAPRPGTQFDVATVRLDNLTDFEFSHGSAAARQAMEALGGSVHGGNTFAFLLIDGLSMKEEPVVSAIHQSLGTISMFGGSAGDGTQFENTHLYHEGAFRSDCAVLTLIRTDLPFRIVKTEHFVSSDKKMVVTDADPANRIVTEINGEPAAQEYARLVGVEMDKLNPMMFAAHPVVVRLGGDYYVRSIQKVNDDGVSLTFFCAIDEGIVLTVAQGVDMVDNLKDAFARSRAEIGPPLLTFGCDCILRYLEVEQRGLIDQVGAIFAQNKVVGFATYGEQYNGMHVNQTFTGCVIGARR